MGSETGNRGAAPRVAIPINQSIDWRNCDSKGQLTRRSHVLALYRFVRLKDVANTHWMTRSKE